MTLRLIHVALRGWAQFDGWATSQGISLMSLSLERFLNLVWFYLIRNAESEADVEKVRAQLWMPPKGVEVESGPWSAASEMAAFHRFKAEAAE